MRKEKYLSKLQNKMHHAAAIERLPNSTILSFLPVTDWMQTVSEVSGEDISALKTKLLMRLKCSMVRRG